ncbi:MAG: ATP-binding cassette domain-containing protein, partial [Chloroflexota bacterium]
MTLAAIDLGVRVGKATLLAQASLSLEVGEIVAVVGPNGAGKTTLVRALAGDIAPTEGSVALAGKPLRDWPGNELAQRRAVMSSDSTVAFGYTAREVALMGRMPLHGGSPTEDDVDVVGALLGAVDCTALGGRA